MTAGTGPIWLPSISPLRFWLAQYQAKPLARYDSYFYILYFYFLQKYIFVFEIYRNIPCPPRYRAAGPGRPAAGRQGLLCKNFSENICAQFPRGRSPGSGAAGPPGRLAAGRPALAARLRGDRISHPYIRVGWSPTLICITKILETKKREGGREAKHCRIFEPATAGNQNSSTLY